MHQHRIAEGEALADPIERQPHLAAHLKHADESRATGNGDRNGDHRRQRERTADPGNRKVEGGKAEAESHRQGEPDRERIGDRESDGGRAFQCAEPIGELVNGSQNRFRRFLR